MSLIEKNSGAPDLEQLVENFARDLKNGFLP
jgi:hypothetical protein